MRPWEGRRACAGVFLRDGPGFGGFFLGFLRVMSEPRSPSVLAVFPVTERLGREARLPPASRGYMGGGYMALGFPPFVILSSPKPKRLTSIERMPFWKASLKVRRWTWFADGFHLRGEGFVGIGELLEVQRGF